MIQATRIISQKSKDLDLITVDDVTNVIDKMKTQKTQIKIGFSAQKEVINGTKN